MPINSMAPRFGIYSPSDLDLLQDVFDEATNVFTSFATTEIAQALFDAFDSGISDREQLLNIARRSLFRPTVADPA